MSKRGGGNMKRMSIRLVPELAESIQKISKRRGISVNALITEMAWSFVESMKKKELKQQKNSCEIYKTK